VLYPHQPTGRDWLAERSRACLADEPGLGKTITAITAADKAQAHSMLVIAPTCVVWNWHHELDVWSPWRQPVVITSGRYASLIEKADNVIVTHGMLLNKDVRRAVCRKQWDLCVVDESHFFRGPRSKRSNILMALDTIAEECVAPMCERVWMLSGTPMPNDPSDLWTMCHGMWPEEFTETYAEFRARYCLTCWTRYGDNVKVIGSKNTEELRERLKGKILRRRTNDVLNLPPVRYETVALKPTKMPAEIGALAEALPEHVQRALLDPDLTPEDALELMGANRAFAEYRRWCGLAKAEAVAELLDFELKDKQLDKVVVMAHHTDVVNIIADALKRYGVRTITGATSAADRTANVKAFQERSDVRVMVCNIIAGGTGNTLTASAELVFAEMSFVPGENTQAAIRIRRIGQERKCRIRFVSLAGTLDEPLVDVLRRKTDMINEVIK
tara:strand:+ start:1418 stop:2746 length:1329 start_codon:yes stop_codon:yes gene_type:complete